MRRYFDDMPQLRYVTSPNTAAKLERLVLAESLRTIEDVLDVEETGSLASICSKMRAMSLQ